MPSKVLDIVYQPDSSTCQSAAISRVTGEDVMEIREALLNMGEPGDPSVMGQYLEPRVKEYKLNLNASLNDAIEALKNGYQLIIHGWFTGSGHVIGLSGYDSNTKCFNAEDPWYEFMFSKWQYCYNSDGNNAQYSELGIYAACVLGQSVDDAIRIYGEGKVNLELKGMWMHIIKN